MKKRLIALLLAALLCLVAPFALAEGDAPQTTYFVVVTDSPLDGSGGTVYGEGQYAPGDTVTISVAPNLEAGYCAAQWACSELELGVIAAHNGKTSHTFVMPEQLVQFSITFAQHSYLNYTDLGDGTHDGVCLNCRRMKGEPAPHADVLGAGASTTPDGYCDDCGLELHSHSYAAEWAGDATHHWHACECGEKADYAEHSYGADWMTDAEGHWHVCACGATSAPEAHVSSGAATEQAAEVCTVCGYEIAPKLPHTHQYGADWVTDAEGHWHVCGCGATSDPEAHVSSGAATEQAAEVCTACGYEIAPKLPHTHQYGADWMTDAEGHWHVCACGATSDPEAHVSSGAATEQAAEVCTVCGYEIAPKLPHTHQYGADWMTDAEGHWHTCACGATSDPEAHVSGGAATEQAAEVCTACGYEIAPRLEHTHVFGTNWVSDLFNHWHGCDCGERADVAGHDYSQKVPVDDMTHRGVCTVCGQAESATAHSGGIATCQAPAQCRDCGAYYGELSPHFWLPSGIAGYHTCFRYGDGYNHEQYEYPCYGGTATCTRRAVCEACGQEYGELGTAHEFTILHHNANGHWYSCACGATTATQAHSGGTATCQARAQCAACGETYGDLAPHAWQPFETDTHKCATCNTWQNCYGGTADCYNRARCAGCNTQYGGEAAHWFGPWVSKRPEYAAHQATCQREGCKHYKRVRCELYALIITPELNFHYCPVCGYCDNSSIKLTRINATQTGANVLDAVVYIIENPAEGVYYAVSVHLEGSGTWKPKAHYYMDDMTDNPVVTIDLPLPDSYDVEVLMGGYKRIVAGTKNFKLTLTPDYRCVFLLKEKSSSAPDEVAPPVSGFNFDFVMLPPFSGYDLAPVSSGFVRIDDLSDDVRDALEMGTPAPDEWWNVPITWANGHISGLIVGGGAGERDTIRSMLEDIMSRMGMNPGDLELVISSDTQAVALGVDATGVANLQAAKVERVIVSNASDTPLMRVGVSDMAAAFDETGLLDQILLMSNTPGASGPLMIPPLGAE